MLLTDESTQSFIDSIDLNNPLHIAMLVIAGIIVLVSIWAAGVSIYLAIKYIKFNRKQNSCGMTGKDIARKILDDNDLKNIGVSKNGSILFGNSYSHYFHKVRLRRLTWKKSSVSSMAMAAQKSSLAVMDKEKDPAMRTRIILTPLYYFGPLAFVPMIIIGVLLDYFVFTNTSGLCTIICTAVGFLFYLIGFVLQILQLKTEKKAQLKAYEIVKKEGLANDEEIGMMKDLFHLYNIEYVNNLILALLEIIWRILALVNNFSGSHSSSSSSN